MATRLHLWPNLNSIPAEIENSDVKLLVSADIGGTPTTLLVNAADFKSYSITDLETDVSGIDMQTATNTASIIGLDNRITTAENDIQTIENSNYISFSDLAATESAILPDTTGTRDIGSSTFGWRSVYVTNSIVVAGEVVTTARIQGWTNDITTLENDLSSFTVTTNDALTDVNTLVDDLTTDATALAIRVTDVENDLITTDQNVTDNASAITAAQIAITDANTDISSLSLDLQNLTDDFNDYTATADATVTGFQQTVDDLQSEVDALELTQYLAIASFSSTLPPASPTATGTKGDIRFDANYIYFCVGTNQWIRASRVAW